jgi:hypothetical protein
MFVIAPEAAETKPPEAEELLPELAIVDYPRTTYRLHWLYMYYLSWGERPLPFLDRRSPLTFPKWKRRAFIHFTNMYYTRWMNRQAGMVPPWTTYAGRLNGLCPDCRRRDVCKELCVLAIAGQMAGTDTNLQMQINAFYSKLGVVDDRYLDPVHSHLQRAPLIDINLCFSEEVIGRRPRLKVNHAPPPLVPIPEDQEEDEEWE